MDLRDITIVKYMGYLDEFSLMLSDKVNLIHRDGFDSSGTVTGLNFFVPISAQYSGEDPALFRVLGSRQMEAGPIHRVTGLNNYENIVKGTVKLYSLKSKPFLYQFSNVKKTRIDKYCSTDQNQE